MVHVWMKCNLCPILMTDKCLTALSADLILNCIQIRQILRVQAEVHLCPYMEDDTLSLFTHNSLSSRFVKSYMEFHKNLTVV